MVDARVSVGELAGDSGVSEDRVFVTTNAVIVLDGVTAVKPEAAGDGGWYADVLGRRLVELLNADPRGDLRDLLEKGIADVVAAHNLVSGRSPACTVAMLRWSDDAVDAVVLGDSPIVVFERNGSHEALRDHRHDTVVDQVRRAHASAAR